MLTMRSEQGCPIDIGFLESFLTTKLLMRFILIFKIWNKLFFPTMRAYARLRRANVHPSVEFVGIPLIRAHRGSKLTLHSGVRIISTCAGNPVVGSTKSRIVTLCENAELTIQKNVGISSACNCASTRITIGEGTIVGADALLADTDFHSPAQSWRWNNDSLRSASPISIGKGCFIGARAIILKGVNIADGSVVAAGAVVTRDVPFGMMAFGNPAANIPLKKFWLRDSVGNPKS